MLLEKLLERQNAEGLSDTQFAVKLGVSYATWRKTKLDGMKIGFVMARGIFQNYPDLRDDTIFFFGAPCE